METHMNTNIIKLEDRFGGSDTSSSTSPINRLPECPDWLNDSAREHWPELIQSLGNHGIINELDRDMLAMYCSMFARFVQLDEQLNDPEGPGMTQKTKSGYEAETATFTAWKSMVKPLMSYAKQLGLTPPARIAMKTAAPGQAELDF